MKRGFELRLMTQIARLYYIEEMRQVEIAARLRMSQATISRLLRRAQEEGIVRVTINPPGGTFPEMEEALVERFGLQEAIVADCGDPAETVVQQAVGEAAAGYLEATLRPDDVLGISSSSASLLRMVDNLSALKHVSARKVVQILGGTGDPAAEQYAETLVRRLARLTHAQPQILPAAGIAGSAAARAVILDEHYVREAIASFDSVTLALVGIGAIEAGQPPASSGYVLTEPEIGSLVAAGAIGDICMRFFDGEGMPVAHPVDDRVIGMTLAQIAKVPRSVAVAGGLRKVEAIRAALRGGWIDVLVTDHYTAQALIEAGPSTG